MKTVFIESCYKKDVDIRNINIPFDKIGLVSSVQFSSQLKNIKKMIESLGKTVLLVKGKQIYPGQILGCDTSSAEKIMDKVDCFLYIGDGDFHPLAVALNTNKVVFAFNIFTNELKEVDKESINKIKKRHKGAFLKFLNSEDIGLLVTTKSGQYDLSIAKKIEQKFPEKNFYYFISNEISLNTLENFNFIECFVNTACPRISEDESRISIINAREILNSQYL